MHIVLHEPEIPGNTGNIGRSCVVTGTSLHLIEQDLDVHTYADYGEFLARNPNAKIWYATTKAHQIYSDVTFGPDDYIMFGKESAGIPEEILVENEETCIRIPMLEGYRSLNLSNSVAIVIRLQLCSMRHCDSRIFCPWRGTGSFTDFTGRVSKRKVTLYPPRQARR